MKQPTFWGVFGVVAIAATLGISTQSSIGPGGGNGSTLDRSLRPVATMPQDSDACQSIAESVARFLALTADQIPWLEACRPRTAFTSHVQTRLKFVIATIPDPIHTHLPLMFDRMTEAIQQAAQDEHYQYDTSWLPWEEQSPTYTHLADQDVYSARKSMREKQPGLLIFRHADSAGSGPQGTDAPLQPYRDGLVVFLVEEDPAYGIHTDQFNNAVEWVSQLRHLNGRNPARLSILGPTFSGSFNSLAKLLYNNADRLNAMRGNPDSRLAIYSGTANSGEAIDGFTAMMEKTPGIPTIDFYSFLERDEVGLERYCKYVEYQGVELSSVAILSEDETVYGAGNEEAQASNEPPANEPKPNKPTACVNALRLYYPRDMSSLRTAYQTNSIFNQPSTQQTPASQRSRLPSDLADPQGKGHDTIRSYSGNQKPLSQEAYLLSIVNVLRAKQIQSVILRSTNAFDQIFLARYLRRAYPNARIVVDGMDRLFARESDSSGMSGTISLSTYPLWELQHQLTPGHPTQSGARQFNADYSEGTYNALRFLLVTVLTEHAKDESCELKHPVIDKIRISLLHGTLPVLSAKCRNLTPPDYSPPSWVETRHRASWPDPRHPRGAAPSDPDIRESSRRPATWLSVLNRNEYWPIAAINEDTISRGSSFGPFAGDSIVRFPLHFGIFVLVLLGFSFFHLWCCRNASFTAKPAFLAHFANPGDREHSILVSAGSAFVALLPLFAGMGYGLFDSNPSIFRHSEFIGVGVLVACGIALAAGFVNVERTRQMERTRQLSPAPRKDFKPAIVGSLLCLSVFGLVCWYSISHETLPANRYFTYFRSVHMFSRVSPMVPIVVLLLGLYAWFWQSLHGLALFGPDRARLPKESDLELEAPLGKVLPMFS